MYHHFKILLGMGKDLILVKEPKDGISHYSVEVDTLSKIYIGEHCRKGLFQDMDKEDGSPCLHEL